MAFGGGGGWGGRGKGRIGKRFRGRRRSEAGDEAAGDTLEEPLLEDDMETSTIPASGDRQQQLGGVSGGDDGGRPRRQRQQHHRTTPHSASWREAIRKMGNYLAYVTLLTMLVVVPTVIYRALRRRQLDEAAYNSAGVMVCGTVVLSLRLVYLHLTHWYMPDVQKYVVRILWMVPIYSVQSYLSIRHHQLRVYIDTVRDLYEAYVIASFVYYLIALLGGEESLVHILEAKAGLQPDPHPEEEQPEPRLQSNPQSASADGQQMQQQQQEQEQRQQQDHGHEHHDYSKLGHHTFPLNLFLHPWELGMRFLMECKHGVLQYVVFKIVSTVITFVCVFVGIYGEGKFDAHYVYPYMCFFQNCSVMYALYCLVKLFHAINDELRFPINWNPLGKFLCVKGVVFFTWWQGVVIFFLRGKGYIEGVGSWSSNDVAYGLINYCVVVEMIAFAIAHSYTFTYKEYLPSHISNAVSMLQQEQHRQSAAESDEGNPLCPRTDNETGTGAADGDDDCGAGPLPASATPSSFPRSSSFPEAGGGGHDSKDDTAHGSLPGRAKPPSSSSLSSSIMSALSPSTAAKPSAASVRPSYRPPATLDRPMRFKDAFWSSTVPKETIRDIQRLRAGVDSVVQNQGRPAAVAGGDDDDGDGGLLQEMGRMDGDGSGGDVNGNNGDGDKIV